MGQHADCYTMIGRRILIVTFRLFDYRVVSKQRTAMYVGFKHELPIPLWLPGVAHSQGCEGKREKR